MRFGLLFLILLGVLSLLPTGLDAQEIRSPYRFIDESNSVGFTTGYFIGDPGSPGVGPHSSMMLGARYTTRLSGPLSGELNLSLVPTQREVIAYDTIAGQLAPTGEMANLNLGFIEGGLRFHLTGARTWQGIAPFVVLTGGLANNLSGASARDLELPTEQRFRFGQAFTLGFGAGTDVFVADRVSLRLEARDHILRLRVPAGLTEGQRAESMWTNNFGLTLGAALHF
jgi:hypothetical protein